MVPFNTSTNTNIEAILSIGPSATFQEDSRQGQQPNPQGATSVCVCGSFPPVTGHSPRRQRQQCVDAAGPGVPGRAGAWWMPRHTGAALPGGVELAPPPPPAAPTLAAPVPWLVLTGTHPATHNTVLLPPSLCFNGPDLSDAQPTKRLILYL